MSGDSPARARETPEAPGPPPRDYRLLVPKDWFRVDLLGGHWRAGLRTFVTGAARGRSVPEREQRALWETLRNTAEDALAHGAVEFFLRPDTGSGFRPSSLLVSPLPAGAAAAPGARELRDLLAARAPTGHPCTLLTLPAGPAVRRAGPDGLDVHVRMPRGAGYLLLSFALPVYGSQGPMAELCEAIAGSLRWIE